MIKIVIHITKFIIATIIAVLFASCNFNNMKSIEGSGNVTTEKRIVQGDFKKVSVSNAIDVVIEQSDKTEIIVEADDNLQKEIKTTVENGTLVIRCSFTSFHNVSKKKVIVKMPVIEELEASSASTISSNTVLHSSSIKLDASSAATMNVNIESDEISLDTDSAGSITIEGKALKVKSSASSAASIDAEKLLANDIEADAESGSSITIHPIVSLKAKANSGGSISYKGSPKSIEKTENSGGSVDQG